MAKTTVTVDKKNKTLTIVMPLDIRPAKSGVNLLLASTRGNQVVDTEYDGKPITVGCNVYVPNN